MSENVCIFAERFDRAVACQQPAGQGVMNNFKLNPAGQDAQKKARSLLSAQKE